MKKRSNLLIELLERLNVKHTKSFSLKYYNQHPLKNNLYGISQMLSDYGIEYETLRFKDKKSVLYELPTPFIANVNNHFVLVDEINISNVEYLDNNKKTIVSIDKFLTQWSGIGLFAEPSKTSIEPNYSHNRKEEIIKTIERSALVVVVVILLGISFATSNIGNRPGIYVSLLLNIIGMYVSYLLLLKQLHIHNNIADRVCSVFQGKSDCNDLLNLNASKLFGIISWSEIGLSFFISNLVIISFFSFLYPYIALINICALPFTVWSIWYQKFKAKVWCPLCLIVQLLLWALFIVNYLSGFIIAIDYSLVKFSFVACVYALPLLIIKNSIPYFINAEKYSKTAIELKSLKANEDVFKTLLTKNRRHEIDKEVSEILLGNSNANNLISIITNPYCVPCSHLHKDIVNLLNSSSKDFCIQLIFTSFDTAKENINKLFISQYFQMTQDSFLTFLSQWYQKGKFNENEFIQNISVDIEKNNVSLELEKHKKWINKADIRATPTILFNGYELPTSKYKLDDLVLLKGINIS